MKITFIGLGIMGTEMVQHLINNGLDITIYNRTPSKMELFTHKNVSIASSFKAAIENADVVITMLSNPDAVKQVMLTDGITDMKKNAIWMDCSTVDPEFSRKCAVFCEEKNIQFIDAPVAGSKPQAQQAELVFFVGGKKVAIDQVTPLFEVMGKKFIHLGDHGSGSSLKMVVNIMLAKSMALFSEAVHFGKSLGLEESFLLNLLPNLVVSAPFTKAKAEMIKEDNYSVQFPLEHMLKDIHLALKAGEENNASMPITSSVAGLYDKAMKDGMGRLDFSVIYKYLNEN